MPMSRGNIWRRISITLITLAAFGLILWDVFAYLLGGSEGTLSNVVLSWAWHKPILALLFGVLMGHLFWPQRRPIVPRELTEDEVYDLQKHFRLPLLAIHRRVMAGDAVGPFVVEDLGDHE